MSDLLGYTALYRSLICRCINFPNNLCVQFIYWMFNRSLLLASHGSIILWRHFWAHWGFTLNLLHCVRVCTSNWECKRSGNFQKTFQAVFLNRPHHLSSQLSLLCRSILERLKVTFEYFCSMFVTDSSITTTDPAQILNMIRILLD